MSWPRSKQRQKAKAEAMAKAKNNFPVQGSSEYFIKFVNKQWKSAEKY